ncbi:hypothetical protein L249_8704 [Ophiocordyceps polyrhachis-furcata BCC 54312]|uniref:Uncharacterized protein n=1 Tax=Ophiocordyceps polyrhachis-furcata BCC 54312 TaxID=1330021 RepID=A0A367L739_9HYPO|nr:hypothetical protein L249_8704 [Ophiocordyceps polyrhachis-furcata BCC 54312]
MRGHHPILPAVLLTIFAFVPDRGALSLPQQAPRAWKFIHPSNPAVAEVRKEPWKLPLSPLPPPVLTYSPLLLLLPPPPPPPPPPQAVNASIDVSVEKSLRSPGASVKQVLYPSTVMFCEHSRYKGQCKEVAARHSHFCYEVPTELQRSVSSVKLINILGRCRFYKDFFCQGDFFETANSVGGIWDDHVRFHNSIYSFACNFPLPIFYPNIKFFGPQVAVDITSQGECAQVPSSIATIVSSLRIPEAIGSCRLYRSEDCQGNFIDAFDDIPVLRNVRDGFNDNIRSIQCPVPPPPSDKPHPSQLMEPQYIPARPLPPQVMPHPSIPSKSRPPRPAPSRTRPPKYGLARSGPLRDKSAKVVSPEAKSPEIVSPKPEPQQPEHMKLLPELDRSFVDQGCELVEDEDEDEDEDERVFY